MPPVTGKIAPAWQSAAKSLVSRLRAALNLPPAQCRYVLRCKRDGGRQMNASPLIIATVTWVVVFAAALLGMWIGGRLPEEHRTDDSRNVVSISMAMVSTLTALVLGLLLSVANTSFGENQEQLMSTSSDVIRMDHLLRLYGPEADGSRDLLRQYAHSMLNDVFPSDGSQRNVENEETLDLLAKVEQWAALMVPANATQRWLQPHILDVSDRIVQEHFTLVKQRLDAIPAALMVLMLLWLVLLFASFGLFAPRHLTCITVLLLSSGAASGAVLLILELETPHSGFVHLSPNPLQHAIDVMEKHGSNG